jgi:hypothetical protein
MGIGRSRRAPDAVEVPSPFSAWLLHASASGYQQDWTACFPSRLAFGGSGTPAEASRAFPYGLTGRSLVRPPVEIVDAAGPAMNPAKRTARGRPTAGRLDRDAAEAVLTPRRAGALSPCRASNSLPLFPDLPSPVEGGGFCFGSGGASGLQAAYGRRPPLAALPACIRLDPRAGLEPAPLPVGAGMTTGPMAALYRLSYRGSGSATGGRPRSML